jgi:hypothetical protein
MSSKFILQNLTEWGNDYILHNIPFVSDEVKGKKYNLSIVSVYELQKSAANWNYSDFKRNKPYVK